ncbi:MAG TPA: hypothetical protein P5275_12255 [Saprospiraceae bacterium]|nr:hypothetical protein [Saprospiraceae bacterium]MCB9268640.1 hypothetical protein [Lewinellaceae bacterium]HPG05772.1 hypothetical protein [Saprospiraceae bacterium]HPR01104.1 hypothetical protein [Saprospiraceae bacterium]HRV85632.1 hypothetical protein [Saprospiraceae bacterium]
MVLPFLLLIAVSVVQDAWIHYQNEAGRFAIDTPYKLQEKIIRTTTEIGLLEYHNFYRRISGSDSIQVDYRVSYVDYPIEYNLSDSAELVQSILETTVDESVRSVNGELLYSNDDYSYQLPGKVWRINYMEGNDAIRAKACIRGNRFYLLQALYPVDKSTQVNDHFFKSFRLQ